MGIFPHCCFSYFFSFCLILSHVAFLIFLILFHFASFVFVNLIFFSFCLNFVSNEKNEKKTVKGSQNSIFLHFLRKKSVTWPRLLGFGEPKQAKKMQNKMHFLQTWFTKTE